MRTAHNVSDDTLIKAGHRLLSALFASYDFPLFFRDDDPDPLHDFLQFEHEEISENLLTISAISRALDDEVGRLEAIEPNFPKGVGWLQTQGANQEPLCIRDACNKIIHAKVVKYDFAWIEENPIWGKWYKDQGFEVRKQYKAPAVNLEGEHQSGKKWSARVELSRSYWRCHYATCGNGNWPR